MDNVNKIQNLTVMIRGLREQISGLLELGYIKQADLQREFLSKLQGDLKTEIEIWEKASKRNSKGVLSMKKRNLDQRERYIKRAIRLLKRDLAKDIRLETTARRLLAFHKAWNRQMHVSSQGAVRLKDEQEWRQTFRVDANYIRQKLSESF